MFAKQGNEEQTHSVQCQSIFVRFLLEFCHLVIIHSMIRFHKQLPCDELPIWRLVISRLKAHLLQHDPERRTFANSWGQAVRVNVVCNKGVHARSCTLCRNLSRHDQLRLHIVDGDFIRSGLETPVIRVACPALETWGIFGRAFSAGATTRTRKVWASRSSSAGSGAGCGAGNTGTAYSIVNEHPL
jgi:hypothetical protein